MADSVFTSEFQPSQLPENKEIMEKLTQFFWDRANKAEDDQCWVWSGNVTDGYGRVATQFCGIRYYIRAHRLAYELLVGSIPTGKVLDHLCRNRRCVNPKHLEPVTSKVNVLRGEGVTATNAKKTICHLGHPLSGQNLASRLFGWRGCRICKRIKNNESKKRVRLRLKLAKLERESI